MLTIRRVRFYGLVLNSFLFANLGIARFAHGPSGIDWDAQLTAGTIAYLGKIGQLYDLDLQSRVQRAIEGADYLVLNPFQSPPVVAYLYLPFSLVPRWTGLIIWDLVSVLLIGSSIWRLLPLLSRIRSFGPGWILLLSLLSWPSLGLLLIGQDTALSFALYAGAGLFLQRSRGALAGALLGLGAFKPQLFVLVPVVLIARRDWRALASCSLVAGTLAVASFALIGPNGVRAYLALVGSDIVLASDYLGKMQTVPAVLRVFLPPWMVFPETALCTVIGAGLVAVLARRLDALGQLSIAILATELTTTHLFFYDTLLLAIPVLWLLDRCPRSKLVQWAVVALYLVVWSEPFRSALFVRAGMPLALLAGPLVALPIAGLLACAAAMPRSEDRLAASGELVTADWR